MLAAAGGDSPEADRALEELCVGYWYPLYAYLRRQGHSRDEAKDLTQELFAQRVVTRKIFRGVEPGKGKFRTWLLNSLQNFLRNKIDRDKAVKRGGGQPHVSLDFADGEARYSIEPASDLTPDRIYEREWVATVIEFALRAVREQWERAGKSDVFEVLKIYLPGMLSPPSYSEAAAKLGKSEDAVKMAVSRLKKELGRALRAEIARTVCDRSEVEEEWQHLLRVVSD